MNPKYIFQEDDALIHGRDPDYPGICGWWLGRFGRDFYADWRAAKQTEEDHGDCCYRTLVVDGVAYKVWYSFDGFAVEKDESTQTITSFEPGDGAFDTCVETPDGWRWK